MPGHAKSSEPGAGTADRLDLSHSWSVTPGEAIAIQRRLRAHLVLRDALPRIARVAGVDVGFEDAGAITRAAVVVLDAETLSPLDSALARRETGFPYVPGLLSFREIPAVLDALSRLAEPPDLLLCDGHGIAHPRRMGIAAHLGLVTGMPSVGVGKSRLVGRHALVPEACGAWVPLRHEGQTIGAVLRSRERVRPIYVSPGHRICLDTALHWVLSCLTRYRLPETTRAADRLASGR